MKFTSTIHINKPIKIVSNAFIHPDSLTKSMKGFVRKDVISGNLNETGAVHKLIYTKFEMTETILENNLPNSFFAQYDHVNMSNTMRTSFKEINSNTTLV